MIATPVRLIPSQHIAPPLRDVRSRASAPRALHGVTTRATLKPARVSDDRLAARGAVGQPPPPGAAAARQLERLACLLQRHRERLDARKRRRIERLGGGDIQFVRAYGCTRERAGVGADFNRGDAAHYCRGNLSLTHEPGPAVNLNRLHAVALH